MTLDFHLEGQVLGFQVYFSGMLTGMPGEQHEAREPVWACSHGQDGAPTFSTLHCCSSHWAFAVLEPRTFPGLAELAQEQLVGRAEMQQFLLPKEGKSWLLFLVITGTK